MNREGSLSCNSCCDTGPRFLLYLPKDPFKVDRHLVLNGVNRNVSAVKVDQHLVLNNVSAVKVDQHLVPNGANRNVSAIKVDPLGKPRPIRTSSRLGRVT